MTPWILVALTVPLYVCLCLSFSPSSLSLCPSTGRAFVPKEGHGKIPDHEQITLEPELEEALKNATDAEMCDIAGENLSFLKTLFVI